MGWWEQWPCSRWGEWGEGHVTQPAGPRVWAVCRGAQGDRHKYQISINDFPDFNIPTYYLLESRPFSTRHLRGCEQMPGTPLHTFRELLGVQGRDSSSTGPSSPRAHLHPSPV